MGTMARPKGRDEWEPFILLMNGEVNRNETPLFDYAQGNLQGTRDKDIQYAKNNEIIKLKKKHGRIIKGEIPKMAKKELTHQAGPDCHEIANFSASAASFLACLYVCLGQQRT